MLPMKFSFLQDMNIINTSSIIYSIYWFIYIIFLLKTVNYIINDYKLKEFIIFILGISFSSTFIMLILPTWGDRITLFNVIVLTIVGVILIDNMIKYNNRIKKIIKISVLVVCIGFIIVFSSIYKINSYREKIIRDDVKNNKEVVMVIRNPFMYLWNNNPIDKYFIDTYKLYMNIPERSQIEICQLSYKEYIEIILGVKK